MTVTRRDYSLTGVGSELAVAEGLADAEWYRPPISPERLQELMARSNARAARDTLLWLALLAGTGTLAFLALGTWWAIPAFAVYAALYGGAGDSRWHECGHGTAFRTAWMNDSVYYLASFMLLREPTMWRWSHARHHTDTIIVGRDPEIIFPRPPSRAGTVLTFVNVPNAPKAFWRMTKHAAGSIDDDARDFIPEEELGKVKWEARVFLAIIIGVVVWSLAAWTIVPLLYIGLPTIYGAWLMVFFALQQHAGLREDVLDHRLNSRTVYMGPILRFLYSNMNYHVEHHIFPTVPYHALPDLHEEVKDHLAPALASPLAAYREILPTLRRQQLDPDYDIPDRPIPHDEADSTRQRINAGQAIWNATLRDGRFDLCSASALEPGQVRRIDVDDRTFAVYCLGPDEYRLTDGLCTHGQAHLGDGLVIDGLIECPKHNGRFDIRTGEPVRRPVRVPLPTYRVDVVEGRLLSDLDSTDPEVST
jgi:Na+-transporting NADH:ubiquinone oxidoreductase subunit F